MLITLSDIYDCQNKRCEGQSTVSFWVGSGYTSTRKASRMGDLPSQATLSVATSWGQEATTGPFTNSLLYWHCTMILVA
jgi:hypothetical protein